MLGIVVRHIGVLTDVEACEALDALLELRVIQLPLLLEVPVLGSCR